MATRLVRNAEWSDFFQKISKEPRARLLRLEVLDTELGDQDEFEWAPLRGISYDAREDELEVMTDTAEHRIPHPSTVFVVEGDSGIESIEVIDRENQKQILSFKPAQAA